MFAIYNLTLPDEADSVPLVRRLTALTLEEMSVADECAHAISTALTEACTNVVRHSGREVGSYEVQVHIDEAQCDINVVDSGVGFDVESVDLAASVDDENGRGILLMRALVDSVDYFSVPGEGTTVSLHKTLVFQDA